METEPQRKSAASNFTERKATGGLGWAGQKTQAQTPAALLTGWALAGK